MADPVGVVAAAGTASGTGPAPMAGPLSDAQLKAVARLRSAFSHLEQADATIAAWLTDAQRDALEGYRGAFGFAPKAAWALEELPQGTTEEEKAQVVQFKELLEMEGVLASEENQAYITDLRLLQYLRARDHHMDKSHQMLVHTLTWRKQHRPWELENANSRTDKSCSDERIVGFDRRGRVVVYSSFARTSVRHPKEVEVNVTAMMEKAAQCIHAGTPGNLIWVNNFSARHKNGFGWRDCDPRFFFSGIDTFMNHYPECLKTMVIVDPPSIFFSTWAVIKKMLAPKTQEKGEILDSRKEATAARFEELFGEELAGFLMEQIKRDESA